MAARAARLAWRAVGPLSGSTADSSTRWSAWSEGTGSRWRRVCAGEGRREEGRRTTGQDLEGARVMTERPIVGSVMGQQAGEPLSQAALESGKYREMNELKVEITARTRRGKS